MIRLSEREKSQPGYPEPEQAEDAEPVYWPQVLNLLWQATHHQPGSDHRLPYSLDAQLFVLSVV